VLREIDFLLNSFWWVQTLHLCGDSYLNTACAGLNHHNNMKAEPSRLIPRRLTVNLEL